MPSDHCNSETFLCLNSQRPRPGRRRVRPRMTNSSLFLHIFTFLVLLMFSCTASAVPSVDVEAHIKRSPELRRLAKKGEILTAPDIDLSPREVKSSAGLTVTAASSTEASAFATATAASTTAATALPSVDVSIGSNYTTDSCPTFLKSFISNSTFKACEPISLLLQNSKSFFDAQASPLLMSLTLDASCGANASVCVPLMESLADDLTKDSNCGQDYRNSNPVVTQLYTGLISYVPIDQATCIKSNSTGAYCFADAITNEDNPSDSYPYYIALGIDLPGGSSPTCNNCLKRTMAVFAAAAGNSSQPVSSTYSNAAELINVQCGPNFVNTTVSTTSSSSRSTRSTSWLLPIAMLGSLAALL